MSNLPKQVQRVRLYLSKDRSNECYEVACKLIEEQVDLVSMWKAIERRGDPDDDLWVWSFLGSALYASDLPPYHYMSLKDRKELSDQITALSKKLARLLTVNDLDAQLVSIDGKLFNGFYFFEDFSEKNQRTINEEKMLKVKISDVLYDTVDRAQRKIKEEPLPGKSGRNVKPIRFIRLMAQRNYRLYGTPLNEVIAISANRLFDTAYQESDICKLLSR